MSEIQKKMFLEIGNKELFAQAQTYAFQYLDTIFDRTFFPSQEALNNLSVFEEVLPDRPTPAKDALEQLDTYGSPATTATLGGRFKQALAMAHSES